MTPRGAKPEAVCMERISSHIRSLEGVRHPEAAPEGGGQVIDIMEALRASLGKKAAVKAVPAKAVPVKAAPLPAEASKERKPVRRAAATAAASAAEPAPARSRARK